MTYLLDTSRRTIRATAGGALAAGSTCAATPMLQDALLEQFPGKHQLGITASALRPLRAASCPQVSEVCIEPRLRML